ncbi:hypothetical protein LTR36_003541 [Oleoguttula mirabilis]|uniref:Uncharacterized protein n=1 Tax=Oleoguttula mirabilis TaxID=1507867 RepID=A0AAV9JJF6_9PEZI|nr:hypothetical protein LTR36_003541 [Oleoguttula mirabilis]
MAARLRMPTLAFAALSICLSIATIGCAGRTINVFNTQQRSNAWLLPVWPNHFDTRELQALIGTSVAILVLNGILVAALLVSALPANIIVLTSALLSTICALVALIFPTILNQHAPTTDTLQTWTCRWNSASISQGQGPPSQFGTICQESRFAFFTTIPVFIIQLLLLGTAVYAIACGRKHSARLGSDVEKGGSQHELGQVRQASLDTKSEGSPRSVQDARSLATKGVQFA